MWWLISLGLIAAGALGALWALSVEGIEAPQPTMISTGVGYASILAFGLGVALFIGSVLYALARAISH